MLGGSNDPKHKLRELVTIPVSLSAWLLAATLFFATIPAIEILTIPACFLFFAAAVFAGCVERVVSREYQTGPALRRAAAAYLAAATLLMLSYIVNAMGPLTQIAEPLSIRGQGQVPVLPTGFMDLIWGRLGAQEPPFLRLMMAVVVMPFAMLAIRLKSWEELRFVLLAWTAGAVCGAVFVVAYCNGLIPGRVEFTWVYFERAHGLTYHPNILGLNSMLALLPVVLLWLDCRSRLVRTTLAGAAVLLWLAIDYSGSRSAVGGAFMLIAMVILARAPDWPSQKKAILLIASLAAVGALLLYGVLPGLQWQPSGALQRLVAGAPGSDAARDIISRVIGKAIWENPVFGAGYQVLWVAHNLYIQLLHAAGVVGLAGLLLAFAIPVLLLRSSPVSAPGHTVRASLTGGVVTWIALCWVQSNPSYFGSALFFALAVYAGLAHRTTKAFDPLADVPAEDAIGTAPPPVRS